MSAVWQPVTLGLFPGSSTPTVIVLADPVRLVAQGWCSWLAVSNRGICPRLASGPLWYAQCGLGLGGRQEWGWPWTEDHPCGSAQAGLPESQRLFGSC